MTHSEPSNSADRAGQEVSRGVSTLLGIGARGRRYVIDPARPGALVAADGEREGERTAARAPAVSVILPVYNEEGLVARTFGAVAAFAEKHAEYEFVFVDDGSLDDTARIVREGVDLAKRDGLAIDLISYRINSGKGHAVKVGVEQARGEFVVFTDGDLAYGLDHLPRLVEALARHDVVIGSRALVHRHERNTTVMRRVTGWAFNKLARGMLGLPYADTQAGLKGFRREAARRLFGLARLGGFVFDVELVYLARRLGLSVGQIPAYVSDTHSYKVSKVRLVRDSVKMLRALMEVRLGAWRGVYEESRRARAEARRAQRDTESSRG